ncbi:MAG: BatA domain-containing protein [Lentisphaeria bacterium]|nr:BatA domain-containing protein [Lentisphaeria bacterium]
MTLLNPILLFGMLFAAVPIAIHLLNRNRYQVERFGGMMFLRQALAVKARRLKLRQFILLLLRCAALALLALALARPVSRPRSGGVADAPTTHIIVLDGSQSMTRGEGAENAFHQAREQALAIVDKMPARDNAQIIWGGQKPTALFPIPTFDKVHIQNRLRSLEPKAESMNAPLALEQAFWAADASRLPRSRVYVLTDGQANGWELADEAVWKRVKEHKTLLRVTPFVYVVTGTAEEREKNVAVTDIQTVSPVLDVFRPARFSCSIHNFASSRQRRRVRFLVDGVLKREQDIDLPPGVTDWQCEHTFDSPGSHYVTVEAGHDRLAVDDRLTMAFVVKRRVRALVIEGRSDENPWQADGGFLRMALEAGAGGTKDGLFDVVTRPQADMDACGIDYLRAFQCVILADVTSVSDFFLFGLERYVEEGGGLLLALGQGAVASEYNRMYKDGDGVLPARLVEIKVYDQRHFQPTFPAGAWEGVVECFDPGRTHHLAQVNVARFWRTLPAENAAVIAHFDGEPFLVSRPYGKGRTMVWTTTINPEWSNVVLTPHFLPLIQNVVMYLSASVTPPVNVRAGQSLFYSSKRPVSGERRDALAPSPAGDKPVVCRVSYPSGEQRGLPLTNQGGEWVGRWDETHEVGVYTFETDDFPTRYFAVRPDPSESDPATLSGPAFESAAQTMGHMMLVSGTTRLSEEIRKETGAREWWQVAALTAVLLLALEGFVSWRWRA